MKLVLADLWNCFLLLSKYMGDVSNDQKHNTCRESKIMLFVHRLMIVIFEIILIVICVAGRGSHVVWY